MVLCIIKSNVGDIMDKKIRDELYKNQTNELYASVVRPTLLYIWRSSPKYAPPERSR